MPQMFGLTQLRILTFISFFRNQTNSNNQGGRTDDSTMTAASLIDAIITHQINQSSSESGTTGSQAPGPPATRPGDRLFQVGTS